MILRYLKNRPKDELQKKKITSIFYVVIQNFISVEKNPAINSDNYKKLYKKTSFGTLHCPKKIINNKVDLKSIIQKSMKSNSQY
jgi:hypothetical protein